MGQSPNRFLSTPTISYSLISFSKSLISDSKVAFESSRRSTVSIDEMIVEWSLLNILPMLGSDISVTVLIR